MTSPQPKPLNASALKPATNPATLPVVTIPSRSTPSTTPATRPAQVIGKTVEGRPIELFRFGNGSRPVLILGGIHGNERNSSECARLLVNWLASHPQSVGSTPVLVIPAANPDGLLRNVRANAHRIDLNRNFPAANWARGPKGLFYGGDKPSSEPESQALIQIINTESPRSILSIHSMPTPCNNYDGPAEALARSMAALNHYPVKDSIGYPTPGSLGSWAGIDRHLPMITLELPSQASGNDAWNRNREAILAFIRQSK